MHQLLRYFSPLLQRKNCSFLQKCRHSLSTIFVCFQNGVIVFPNKNSKKHISQQQSFVSVHSCLWGAFLGKHKQLIIIFYRFSWALCIIISRLLCYRALYIKVGNHIFRFLIVRIVANVFISL